MATRLVRYEMAAGGTILVEEEIEDRGGLVGRGDLVAEARQKFEDALATLRPAASAVMSQIEGLAVKPDEVTLELGFSLKGELGAVIAKTAAEGSFKLSIKWKPRSG